MSRIFHRLHFSPIWTIYIKDQKLIIFRYIWHLSKSPYVGRSRQTGEKIYFLKIWSLTHQIYSSHRQKSNRTKLTIFWSYIIRKSFLKFFFKKIVENIFFWNFVTKTVWLQIALDKPIFEIFIHLRDEKTSIFSKLFEFLKIFWLCLFPTKIWVKTENSFFFSHISSNFDFSWETDKLRKFFLFFENMKVFV